MTVSSAEDWVFYCADEGKYFSYLSLRRVVKRAASLLICHFDCNEVAREIADIALQIPIGMTTRKLV